MNRNFDALERAVEMLESCCKMSKEEPSLIITSQKWTPIMAKIMFELSRRALEVYGLTGEMDTSKLHGIFAHLDYLYDGLEKKKTNLAKFTFEVLCENREGDSVKLLPIEDFFNDSERDEHIMAISIEFRTSFGLKQLTSKTLEWDGKASTADDIIKQRSSRETYLIRVPNGKDISKQMLSETIFDREKEVSYGSQPKLIHKNNLDPHLFLCPDTRCVGTRLILD